MSAAQPVLGNLRVARGCSTRASSRLICDESRELRMVAREVAAVAPDFAPRADRGIVVELKPRTFTETAAHFLKITKPVHWPVDNQPDID
jgi:hypothetical protein